MDLEANFFVIRYRTLCFAFLYFDYIALLFSDCVTSVFYVFELW